MRAYSSLVLLLICIHSKWSISQYDEFTITKPVNCKALSSSWRTSTALQSLSQQGSWFLSAHYIAHRFIIQFCPCLAGVRVVLGQVGGVSDAGSCSEKTVCRDCISLPNCLWCSQTVSSSYLPNEYSVFQMAIHMVINLVSGILKAILEH